MKKSLTVETVELQQCAPNPESNPPSNATGSPHTAIRTFPFEPVGYNQSATMASSNEAAFVEDVDIDQELRSRATTSRSRSNPHLTLNRPVAHSQRSESDAEDAPLLSPTSNGYGSVDGDENENDEEDWPGAADFRGLPWWKRPSVGLTVYQSPRHRTNQHRYTGYFHHSCCSP